MKHVVGILFVALMIFSACSEDPSESAACKKATEELEDATEAWEIFERIGPPDVCNPVCSAANQAWQKERARLKKEKAIKEGAKVSACGQ